MKKDMSEITEKQDLVLEDLVYHCAQNYNEADDVYDYIHSNTQENVKELVEEYGFEEVAENVISTIQVRWY